MIARMIAVMTVSALPALAEETLVLPSGLKAHLQEVITDQPIDGLMYRFRFVAPEFTAQEDFEAQTADLEHLCNDYALPRISSVGPKPSRIVISLADQPTEFGQFDERVTQIFETFSLKDGRCMLELF